jgi:hypothetical protein
MQHQQLESEGVNFNVKEARKQDEKKIPQEEPACGTYRHEPVHMLVHRHHRMAFAQSTINQLINQQQRAT